MKRRLICFLVGFMIGYIINTLRQVNDMDQPTKPIKIEMPVSPEVDVVIIFSGTPDRESFARTHSIIDIVEASLNKKPVIVTSVGEATIQMPDRIVIPDLKKSYGTGEDIEIMLKGGQDIPVVDRDESGDDRPKEKRKYNHKDLGPCPLHPTSKRNGANRCIECDKIRSDARRGKPFPGKGDKITAVEPKGIQINAPKDSIKITGNTIINEAPPAIREFEYSTATRCPECGAGMVRLKRVKGIDTKTGYWIHDRTNANLDPCKVKIIYYKNIKVDSVYSTHKNREAYAKSMGARA